MYVKDYTSLHLGHFGDCTSSNPCGEDEGDCDHDEQCKENHKCGIDNCKNLLGFESFYDCCYDTEEGFCTLENLCDINQGDCDANDECSEGLVCGLNNCEGHLGYDAEVDCCYESFVGDEDFCALGIPCALDEGDCDSNEECELFCGSNNCPQSLGFDSEVDCCFDMTTNTIISENYPNNYPDYDSWSWTLTANIGSIINLQFHSFQVCIIISDKKELPYLRL